jgi:WD40 repeat protein
VRYLGPSGRLALGEESGEVAILDPAGSVTAFNAHNAYVWRIVSNAASRAFLTVPFYPDNRPRLWDFNENQVGELVGHNTFVYDAAIRPDGREIVTTTREGEVRFWTNDGVQLGEPLSTKGQAVAFSPDGKKFVTGGSNVQIWDDASRALVREFDAHPGTGIDTLTYDATGARLLTAGWDDHLAKVWDPETGKLLARLEGHTGRLMAAEFSPDGKTIVTASFDRTARIWESRSGELLRTISGVVHAATFAPDGKSLVVGIGGDVFQFDITFDERSPEDLAAYVAAKSPWKLVQGRLVLETESAPTAPAKN